MLKFLTHKLKTHSINDENQNQKAEEDEHDSGTESDDEYASKADLETGMESEESSIMTAFSRSGSSIDTTASPNFLDSALPSDCDQGYDQHSSEEELEVINCTSTPSSNASHKGQEKRKWSQVTPETVPTQIACFPQSHTSMYRSEMSSGSSDEEVFGFVAAMAAPVEFRTSPPLGTLRPYSAQFITQEASPRKRHRHAAPPRPCLNFEKMQQLKARAVTAWRHTGDRGNELSVYCW